MDENQTRLWGACHDAPEENALHHLSRVVVGVVGDLKNARGSFCLCSNKSRYSAAYFYSTESEFEATHASALGATTPEEPMLAHTGCHESLATIREACEVRGGL